MPIWPAVFAGCLDARLKVLHFAGILRRLSPGTFGKCLAQKELDRLYRVARSVLSCQGMKFAVPKWEGRISPVFDVADNILLVDASDGCEHRRQEVHLTTDDPFERARLLRTLGANVLICGMLSLPQQRALASVGIRIIPHIRGDVGEVIEAFLKGQLDKQPLVMPGCRRRPFRKRRDGICCCGKRIEP